MGIADGKSADAALRSATKGSREERRECVGDEVRNGVVVGGCEGGWDWRPRRCTWMASLEALARM